MTPRAGSTELLEDFQAQLQSMIALADDAQEFLIAATLSMACDHVDQRLAGLQDGRASSRSG